MSVDLHLHTLHSDGNWTPRQLVEKAVELKLKHIAITDHDTTAGIAEGIATAAGRLEVIPGIEINTIWKDETGEEEDVHVLGYFIDPDNSDLRQVLERQQSARLKLVDDIIEKLKDNGIHLTFADVQSCAGTGSIGRPHITQALVKAGAASDVNVAYEKFMSRKSPYYVSRRSVHPRDAVEGIVKSGGIASVAHPGKSKNIEKILLQLQSGGLRAVEAYHHRHTLDTVKHYIRFAHKQGMLITGGSDCHGPFGEFPPSIGSISVPLDVVTNLRAALSR